MSPSPYINRFLSVDTIVPGYTNPQNLNRFSYTLNNPLRYTDPSGHMQCEDYQGSCLSENQVTKAYATKLEKYRVARMIRKKFRNIAIKDPNAWRLQDLNQIYSGLNRIDYGGFDGDTNAINTAFGNVTFESHYFPGVQVGDAVWSTGVIRLEPGATMGNVIHEMGHILDGGLKRQNNHLSLYSETYVDVFDSGPGTTKHGTKNSKEDFADSFLFAITYGSQAQQQISTERIEVITALIQSYTYPDHTLSPGR